MISTLVPTTWDTNEALQMHLESCGRRSLLIGLGADERNEFYSFSVASSFGLREIGVICAGFGIPASAVLVNRGRRLLVGHDGWVTWIDLDFTAIIAMHRLDGVFCEFIPVDCDDEIVVIDEIGLLRVDMSGTLLWSVSVADIIVGWHPDNNGNLVISQMEGPKLTVSIATGKVSGQTYPSIVEAATASGKCSSTEL